MNPSIFYETTTNCQSFAVYMLTVLFCVTTLYLAYDGITILLKRHDKEFFDKWKEAARKLLLKPGFTPKKPTNFSATALYLFCLFLGFMQVGPIRVFGQNRLPKKGRILLAPTHINRGDAASVQRALTVDLFQAKPLRYMMAVRELRGPLGCGAVKSGAIAVFLRSKRGRQVSMQAGMTVFKTDGGDARLVVFASGKLVNNELILRKDYKPGIMLIARKVARDTGEPVYIVPMVIHYKRDARAATMFHSLLRFVFRVKRFRNLFAEGENYGATVVIGKPLIVVPPNYHSLDKLPASRILPNGAEAALDIYVHELRRLQQVAFSKCMPWKGSACNCARLRQRPLAAQ